MQRFRLPSRKVIFGRLWLIAGQIRSGQFRDDGLAVLSNSATSEALNLFLPSPDLDSVFQKKAD